MNYELAKELKEAGFKQGPYQKVFDEVKEFPERAAMYAEAYGVSSLDEIAHFPDLEELIEACGEEFDFLANNRNGTWQASGGEIEDCLAATPSEAVARLWLELHKKPC